jgi:NadR type nicotinamide-nucleotide adenylyltransferase
MEQGHEITTSVKKVAITGPESTGKSTLTKQLAEYFCEPFVPEFARDFLTKKGGLYTETDLVLIADGQIQSENSFLPKATRFLFCDTEMTVMKIWSEVKFKTCSPRILQLLDEQEYVLYLLCSPDIPWQDDPLREHPHLREELFEIYVNELEKAQRNYIVVKGNEHERFIQARDAILGVYS